MILVIFGYFSLLFLSSENWSRNLATASHSPTVCGTSIGKMLFCYNLINFKHYFSWTIDFSFLLEQCVPTEEDPVLFFILLIFDFFDFFDTKSAQLTSLESCTYFSISHRNCTFNFIRRYQKVFKSVIFTVDFRVFSVCSLSNLT